MIKTISDIEQIFLDFSSSKSLMELNNKFSQKLSEFIPIIESSLFSIKNNFIIDFSEINWLSEIFKNKIEYFEEQGIIKWIIQSKKMLPIKNSMIEDSKLNYYILPVYFYDQPQLILIFSSNIDESEVVKFEDDLKILTLIAGIIWINLNDKIKTFFYEKRFEELENQIFNLSFIDSLSHELLTISDEITTTLKLIETNFHLVLSGIGDSNYRINIINSNFEYLNRIINKVKQLLTKNIDNGTKYVNLQLIIGDIIDFTKLKLHKNNIEIVFKFDEEISKPIIYASYSEIEKALFNIILFCSNLLIDGGIIEIYLSETFNRYNLTITDNSSGMDNDELANLFKPIVEFKSNSNVNLYFAKKAILKNNGTLSFHSFVDKGNTFKLSFPKIKTENK